MDGNSSLSALKVPTTMECLPVEIVTHILKFLAYEELSFVRAVSKSFDAIARQILNSSFFRLGEELEAAMSSVKRMLPKRESQRRNHSLSRVNEVYSALETRYALLGMTFRKHIDDDSCCFIAGKVLDEAFSVLRILNNCVKRHEQPRETQELLKDIRDYSSMAMEYFDDNIAPTLRSRDPLSALYRNRCRYSSLTALARAPPTISLNDSMRSLCSTSSSPTLGVSSLALGVAEVGKMVEWRKNMEEKLKKQEKTIAEQDRVIREQGNAINSIIECIHQMNSKASTNCAKNLKALTDGVKQAEEDAPKNERRGRKRRANDARKVKAKKLHQTPSGSSA